MLQREFDKLVVVCRNVYDDFLSPEHDGEIVERHLKEIAETRALEYTPRPPMIECRACSIAGGADRAVYHEAPECSES